jgi:preprotein translocase subunit SecB
MSEDKKNQKKATKTPVKAKKSSVVEGEDQTKDQGPGFGIEKLFLKDVSVEVPNTPDIFTIHDAPLIDIELNNSAVPVSEGYYQVSLQVTVTAKQGEQTAFLIDVTQSGIFALKNVPKEGIEMVLAITCPNILFPYAREAISDLIVKAGFSSVLLNPINFEALYMQQKEEQASGIVGNAN